MGRKSRWASHFDDMEKAINEYLASDFSREAKIRFWRATRFKSRRWLRHCILYGLAMMLDKMAVLLGELDKLKEKGV